MISQLITLPYKTARLPLSLADKTLGDRLPETSAPRVLLDRAIGSADKLAGSVLGDQVIAQRGADRLERSSKLVTADRLDQQADARRAEARATVVEGTQEAAQKRKAAADRVAKGLDEADTVEARGKQAATAQAEKAEEAKKAAVQKRAADRAAVADRRKKATDTTAEAKKKVAQRKAQKELDDARERSQSAAGARADAERLSDLAETKKKTRKSS